MVTRLSGARHRDAMTAVIVRMRATVEIESANGVDALVTTRKSVTPNRTPICRPSNEGPY